MKAVPWEIFTGDYMFCSPLQLHLHHVLSVPWAGPVLGCIFPHHWGVVTFLWVIICGGDGKYFSLSLSFCVSILRKEIRVGWIVLSFSVKMKGSLQ